MINKSLRSTAVRSTLLSPLICLNLGSLEVNAQVVPDNTLGSEQSIVNPVNSVRDQIEGGAIRGGNLFHSFQEFNVRNRASVYFANPAGIENILSRVTGTNPSNIFGTLGVLGEANLFLINPNGILFGPNARLDLRGSFFASTADSIRLGENGEFSATQPNNNTLLTVNPSALFVNQLQAQQSIINQSTADGVGLQVQPGQTLGLIGGNIILDGGILTAEQGRIELGSVGDNSTIQLNRTETGFILDYSDVANFQDIQLSNGALVDVSGEGGGSVQIQGQQVSLTEGSFIQSNTLGSERGGTLTVNADRLIIRDGSQIRATILGTGNGTNLNINADNIEVSGLSADQTETSGIFSDVAVGSSGKAGDLTVNTERLRLFDGGQLAANVFGIGQGGNMTINSNVIEVIGVFDLQNTDPQLEQTNLLFEEQIPSRISTLVFSSGTGNGGNITINTQQLTVQAGASLGTGTTGAGDSGNLRIQAEEIEVSGVASTAFPNSAVFTSAFFGEGNGGNLTIETDRLSLRDGGQIRAGTSSMGNSGNITVRASEIEVNGSSGNGLFPSAILADVENLDNLFPGAIGSGNGGNILIETDRLILQDGGQVSAQTFGSGNGGNLDINASERIEASRISPDGEFVSGLFNSVGSGSSGNGGNITVNTPFLSLTQGGSIGANVFASGDAGDVTINTNIIEVIGSDEAESADPQQQQTIEFLGGQIPSGISTLVLSGGTGKGGNINIETQQLIVREGANIGTGTTGEGDSGNLNIQADDIEVSGVAATGFPSSNLFTSVISPLGTGKGGDLNIEAQRITLRDGGRIQSGTSGSGDSGNMMIRANDIELVGRSADGFFASSILTSVEDLSPFIPGAVGSGNGGNLTIESDRITLTDGGEITASTFSSGNAGNVFVNATNIEASGVSIVNQFVIPSGLRVDVFPGSTGNGGNLTVNTERLILRDGGQLSTNMFGVSETAQSGNLTVNATEIEATGISANSPSGLITNVQGGAAGNAGTLTVNTERLILREGAEISSVVVGTGQGGNLEINASEIEAIGAGVAEATNPLEEQLLQFLGGTFPSGVLTTVLPGATGDGGNLTVNTERITLKEGAQIGSGTFGGGNSGDLRVQATSEIEINGVSAIGFPPSSILTSVLGGDATGNGGNATIEAQRINLRDGGQIRSGTSGKGNSGDLTVQASEIKLTGASVNGRFASSILTEVEDLSDIAPGAIGSGDGGTLVVNSDRILVEEGAAITASSFGEGTAGSLNLNANSIQLNNGIISAETATGTEGNITLNTEQLRLGNNSSITTNAMTEATGGNIHINTQIAIASDHSRISANAVQGQGGNIELNAEVLFVDNSSQITATSAFGIDGNIELNALSNPTQGVVRLSNEIVDVGTLVSQALCQPTAAEIAEGSSLVITGRGGLPPSPTEPLTALQGLVEWESAAPERESVERPDRVSTSESDSVVVIRYPVKQHRQIRQAQGWVKTTDGKIVLTEVAPTVTPQGVRLTHPDCVQS